VLKLPGHRGFTLIEVMVALTIVALMVMLGLPSMSAYYQNAKLGSAAQTYAAGLQVARTEAIRRNAPVEFLLTNTPIVPATIANAAVPLATGRGWVVRVCDAAGLNCELVEAKSVLEGSGQAAGSTPSISVAGTAAAGPTFTGSVFFNGFGAITVGYGGANAAGEVNLVIDNQSGGQCAPAGPMRCLNVRAAPGGQIRVCDPLAAGGPAVRDSRAC
jgi:type IV fimbrial biogenesis protein FimT